MRVGKPAAEALRALRFDWWTPALIATLVLAVWLFGAGGLLLWAVAAVFITPLLLLATSALLLLPGLALLRLCWPTSLPSSERWPMAIGLSITVPPLLLLLSAPLGLRWNTWLCWGFLLLCMAVMAWPRPGERWTAAWHRRDDWQPDRQHLLLIALTLAAMVARLGAARELPVGLLGDSYHHTMIAQLLVDNGGLFSSWEPYAQLSTFTYHFGFHSGVAWLNWLSGEPVTRGVVVFGQLQSALAAPMAYLLTRRTLGSSRAGLWAALIVGFVSAMPAFYVNWGRYTQLAGQTSLPAVCVAWMALLEAATGREARGPTVRLAALAALVTAGLALTHYRVAVFAACFVASYAVYIGVRHLRDRHALIRVVAYALPAALLALLLIVPWLLRLREGALLRIAGNFVATNIGSDGTNGLPPLANIFALYAKGYLVALAALGILLLLWRRQWRGLTLAGWAALVWLAANPYLIGLNGAGIITSFAVLIGSYLLLAPLAAAALDIAYEWAARSLSRRYAVHQEDWSLEQLSAGHPLLARLAVLAGLVIVLWSLGWQSRLVTREYQLFTTADEQAMEWIERNLPPEATFFVNSFTAYGGSLYVGSDGGWWLPFMARRRSNLPPITYGSEAGEQPGYYRAVNTANAEILRHPLDTPAAAEALRAAGFGYLYDGPTAVGLPAGQHEYIDPALLAGSELYTLIYRQAGVTIWRVR